MRLSAVGDERQGALLHAPDALPAVFYLDFFTSIK